MVFLKKIKAGALQYVLVVSVIIAIIIFAFISLIYLQQKMTIKYQFSKEAISNVQMGFEYFMQKEFEYNTQTNIQFSDNDLEITTIEKKHWGIFDIGMVTSKVKNESFQKIGLLGTQNKNRETLYLQDNNQALVLVGKTKIMGTVYLPRQGVKSGNISGNSYYGNQLIYGIQQTSTSKLPEIKNIDYLKKGILNYNENSFENLELEDQLKLHQSFTEKTLLFEDNKTITLTNLSLSGNIIIVSKTAIIINSSAILEDIILIAPKITVHANTKGNFQAIATKNIEIQTGCQLKYPSAFLVLEEEKINSVQNQPNLEKEESQIKIENNCSVKGIVAFYSKNESTNYKPQISIEENTIVNGEVFCSKNLDLKGTVLGSVYTKNFIANQFGGIYINHIYNGVINSKELPNQYAGLQINQFSNSVAKWIN